MEIDLSPDFLQDMPIVNVHFKFGEDSLEKIQGPAPSISEKHLCTELCIINPEENQNGIRISSRGS